MKDYDFAGKKRPDQNAAEGATVKFVVDSFLTKKKRKRDAGEIQPRTFNKFFTGGTIVADAFGRGRQASDLTPDDFGALRAQREKKLGPVSLATVYSKISGGWGQTLRLPPDLMVKDLGAT